mgnify:CR=1 FL=1
MAKSPLNSGGGLAKLFKLFGNTAKQYGKKAAGKTKAPAKPSAKPSKPQDPYAKERGRQVSSGKMTEAEARDAYPDRAHWEDTATPEQVVEMGRRAGVNVPPNILDYHPKFRQTVIDNYNHELAKKGKDILPPGM